MSCVDKLAKIKALILHASSKDKREAGKLAKQSILTEVNSNKPEQLISYRISFFSPWEKRLFVALCSKYGVRTYRYEGQKYATARLDLSKHLMEEFLWPEYLKYSKMLSVLIEDMMMS